SDAPKVLEGVRGDALEIHARLKPGVLPRRVGLRLHAVPDGQAGTDLWYQHAAGQLHRGALCLADGEALDLRIFVDRSVIEVFANGRLCQTLRAYPEATDAQQVALVCDGEGKA